MVGRVGLICIEGCWRRGLSGGGHKRTDALVTRAKVQQQRPATLNRMHVMILPKSKDRERNRRSNACQTVIVFRRELGFQEVE